MKIALFSDTFTPEVNGVSMSVRMLKEGLEAQGHEVWMIAPQNPLSKFSEERVVRIPSLPVFILPENRAATPIEPRVMSLVKEHSFDLIHVHTEFGVGLLGFRAGKRYDIPLVYTYHTVWEQYTHYVTVRPIDPAAKLAVRLATREITSRANRIIAPTNKTANLLRSYKAITPIDIIPTGVDLSRFSPADEAALSRIKNIKESYGIEHFEHVLVSVGRVAPEKSIFELLKMTEPYLIKNPNTVFLIVGDGSSLNELKKFAAKSPAKDQFVFTGTIPWEEVPDYYRLADIFVGNSSTETQGLTFIESLACGTPISCRYNECFDGIIEDGISGTLFSSAKDYLPSIEALLNDSELYDSRKKAGLEAAARISKESFVQKVIRCYEDAISGHDLMGGRRSFGRAITHYSEVIKNKVQPGNAEGKSNSPIDSGNPPRR